MIDVTDIVVAVIGLLSVIITSVVVPWLKSKTNTQNQETIHAIAMTAVYAAQQILKANEDKKNYAMNYMVDALKERGISLSIDEIEACVEAALKDIKINLHDKMSW